MTLLLRDRGVGPEKIGEAFKIIPMNQDDWGKKMSVDFRSAYAEFLIDFESLRLVCLVLPQLKYSYFTVYDLVWVYHVHTI